LHASQRGLALDLSGSLLVIGTFRVKVIVTSNSEEIRKPLKSRGSEPPQSKYKQDYPNQGGD
jgi:hypothetical protein